MSQIHSEVLLWMTVGAILVFVTQLVLLFFRIISTKFPKTLVILNSLGIVLLIIASGFMGNGRPSSTYFLKLGQEYQVTPIDVPHGSFESPVLLHPLPGGQQQYFLVNPEVTEPGVYLVKEENGKKVLKKK